MGLQIITPGPHTSKPALRRKIWLYLLLKVEIQRVNHVLCTDLTYPPPKSLLFASDEDVCDYYIGL